MKFNLSIVVFFYEKCLYRSAFIGFQGQTNTFPYVDHIFDKTIHHLDGVMGCWRNAQFFLATWNGRIINCLIVYEYAIIIISFLQCRTKLLPERSGRENEVVHRTALMNAPGHRPSDKICKMSEMKCGTKLWKKW